ncbi:tape measure protein [Cytobacillus purgationiresistens]|uniref:Tape measure domain-containing protein n=1 Tax=Cytobacillus purgationiresistens TaxID=863449 RepID=A0ABU0AFA5_9BACI|nr:tape measure protein [Cytobacillus purgationiresistens]MDQ0269933.1 tape measure domain-containing protein [Cytobacillus purgationiresistens]
MSGAQTTLSLQDRLTGPLTKIMRAMDSTIRVMEQMDSSTQRLDQRSLANARRNISSASADLERLRSSMASAGRGTEAAARQQERFNHSLGDGLSVIKDYAGGLLAAIGAYQVFNAAKNMLSDMFSRGVDFHAFRQSSEVAFTTFLGDAEKAKQYMDDMYAFALKTPFAYPDLLESSRNLIAFGIEAQNTFPIMQAIGDAVAGIGGGNAEMQNMADIFGQIQSQGKLTMMEVNRLSSYGVNSIEMLAAASGTTGDEIRKQISSGAIGAGQAISTLVEGMNDKFGGLMEGVKGTWRGAIDSMNSARRNAGAAMMKDFMEPLTNAVGVVTDGFKKVPVYIGPAVAAFIPLLNMFNKTFSEGRFDGVFSGIGASLTFLATLLFWVGQSALWIAGIFADNWSWIAPILTALAAVLGTIISILLIKYAVLGLIRLATLVWATAQWAVNAAYLANPIGWVLLGIVAVIALVIYAMVAWGEQTAVVIGWIVGSIYWLGAVFYNVLMGIGNFGIVVAEWFVNIWNQAVFMAQLAWIGFNLFVRMVLDGIGNKALSVAEFFIDTWNNATYSVQMFFYHLQKFALTVAAAIARGVEGIINSALSAISSLVSAAAGKLNSLIGMVNNIPGVNISAIGSVDLKISNKASSAIDSFKNSLEAPTKAATANLGRMNTAGEYMSSVNLPNAPEKVSFGRLDYANTGAAFDKGYNVGSNMSLKASDKLSNAVDKVTGVFSGKNQENLLNAGEVPTAGFDPNLGGGGKTAPGAAGGKGKGNNPTGGKLDSIGKIDNEINIAEEDLKILRDLADIRSIQNFVTLTPQVTFGDLTVREESDINKIVRKIEKMLEDEMENSAKGVYK